MQYLKPYPTLGVGILIGYFLVGRIVRMVK
jgi:hypothetical protein